MIVESSLLDHPKFQRLEKLIGAVAIKVLLRLWGHCQEGQKGSRWEDWDADYVTIVCRWGGEPEMLMESLLTTRWIEVDGSTLVIRNWDEWNASLVKNWKGGQTTAEKWKKGQLSSKPKAPSPPSQEAVPRAVPMAPPPSYPVSPHSPSQEAVPRAVPMAPPPSYPVSPHSPSQEAPPQALQGGDRSIDREIDRESSAREGEGSEVPDPEKQDSAHVPSAEEVVTVAQLEGIPPEFAREWCEKKSIGRYWFNTRGELIDWRRDLRDRWVKKRHVWKPTAGADGPQTVQELETELAAIPLTEPGRRAVVLTALLEAKERSRR